MEAIVLAIAFAIFVVLPFLIGSSRNVKGHEDYVVGERNIGFIRLTAGLSATFIGGSAILNLGALGYQFGWYALADVIPTALALVLVGVFLVHRIRSDEAYTLGGLIGENPKIKVLSGLLSVFVYTFITAAQILALASLLKPYFGFSLEVTAIFSSFFVFLYVMWGGYKSVMITDVFQFILMTFAYLGFVWVGFNFAGLEKVALNNTQTSAMPIDLILLLGLSFFFVPISQDLHIRLQSSRVKIEARGALFSSSIFYLLFGITSVLIGLTANSLGLQADAPDQIVPLFLDHAFGAWSIVPIVAILAVIMSTLDSVLFVSTSSLSEDVYRPLTNKLPSVAVSRFCACSVFVAAVIIALIFPTILSLILSALVLYVSILLPLLIGKFFRISEELLFPIAMIFLVLIVALEVLQITFPFRYALYAGLHLIAIFLTTTIMNLRRED